MTRSKKIMIGAGSILLVLALAGGLWLMSSPTLVTFAQAPTPTTPATPGTWQAYQEAFLNALATRLGTTIDQLKQAYQGAFNDTVDQAVTDGNLTQDQATQMKDKTGQMLDQGVLPGFAPFGPKGGRGGHGFKGEGVFGMRGGFELNTFAQALNMTQADLMTELQSGKTLAQIVTEKNGDLNQIKTTVLENLKTKLDQAVQNGQMTQDQADQTYNQASTNFDTMVNQTVSQGMLPGFEPFGLEGGRGFKGDFFWMRGGVELNTFAQALNMTEPDLMTELQSGKTLAQIVTEKNGDLNQIKTTVLENLKTKLDQAVADGNLTQAQADEMYNQASTNFDTMVNQTWQGKPWGERMMPENPTQNQDFPNWNAPVNPNWQNQ